MNSRLLPVIALFVAVGIFFAYVRPTWNGPITEAKTALMNDDQALAAAGQYSAQQNQLASARNAIDPDKLAQLAVFLPDSADNVGLILDLNALAARSGLSLSNIDVAVAPPSNGSALAAKAPSSPVSSVDLSVSAVGTYAALQSFLAGVERSARLIDVRDIVVKGSETGVYNYQMTLRIYWLH